MNETEDEPEFPSVDTELNLQNSHTDSLQENDLLSPSRRSKRLQKDYLLESKSSDVLPTNKTVPKENIANRDSTTQSATSSVKSCCDKNVQCETSNYLFGLYDQEIENNPNSHHKFYGCKRKGLPSPCSESFGLPDDPIFSNSPIFLDRSRKCSLDTDIADPWDISVLDLEYIDQPWLVEYPEVITPYWDVESLFPFEVEDIRQKIEPQCHLSQQKDLSDSFNISYSISDVSGDRNESDNVFTSTPVHNQNSSLSVVSTINISGEDSNVDIAVLKDEVFKALEEAIKKKSTIGSIDMKIQIVTSDVKGPVTSPKKNSAEVKTNENVETESCRSSSSSKENYFIGSALEVNEKAKRRINTKELNTVTLSNLNDDWDDSPGSDVNDHSQDESAAVNKVTKSRTTKTSKKSVKIKKNVVQGVRRSLRFQEPNVSTENDKEALTNSNIQLPLDDSLLKLTSTSTTSKLIGISKASEDQLKNNYISKDISQQHLDIEDQSDSKRVLRSSFTHKDAIQNDSTISKNTKKPKKKDSLYIQHKDDSNKLARIQTERPQKEELELSQSKDGIEFAGWSKNRAWFLNEDSQSSQDDSDCNEVIGKNRLKIRRSLRNRELQSNQVKGNIDNAHEKLKTNEGLTDIDLPNKGIEVDNKRVLSEQAQENTIQNWQDSSKQTSKSIENQATLNNANTISKDKPKRDKILKKEESILSQDGSNTSKKKENLEGSKRTKNFSNTDSQSNQNDSNIIDSVLEDTEKDISQLKQTESSINKSTGSKDAPLTDDSQLSQNYLSQDDLDKKRKRGRPRKTDKLQEKVNNLLSSTPNESSKAQDFSKNPIEDIAPLNKRILRSSTQHQRPDVSDIKEGRRRTLSSSASEKSTSGRNDVFPTRKRSVSANFDSTSIRRSLRSYAAEPIKTPNNIKSSGFPAIEKSPSVIPNVKSSRISFDLSNSFKESPRRFNTDSPLKSILKNVYDSSGRLIGVKIHREKHVKMPSALEIKPEDEDVGTLSQARLNHQTIIPTELELNSIKKEEEFLKEKGITSRIKIVISPLDIKEETEDQAVKMRPILPLALPESEIKCETKAHRKSGRFSNISQETLSDKMSESAIKSGKISSQESIDEKGSEINVKIGPISNITPEQLVENQSEAISEGGISNITPAGITGNKSETVVRWKKRTRKIIDNSDTKGSAESTDIKTEETEYNLGNFVWAQVGKFPYWPGIVCYDPITETFQKEAIVKKYSRIYYHVRFFGDYGKRAWVSRKHIMLYCSKQDLELIANKLKSENKNYNSVKPYLVTGSLHLVEKWHKAVEELDLLKNQKYENIITHMLESYTNHLQNRKRKKSQSLDASSESESEEPTDENRPRKKFKSFEHSHVTADNSVTNNGSEGFDEINITIGAQNDFEASVSSENHPEKNSESSQNPDVANEASNKQLKFKTAVKGLEILSNTSTPKVPDNELTSKDIEKVSEDTQESQISDKITPRRSRRSLKPVDSLHVTAESIDKTLDALQQQQAVEASESSETPNDSAVKLGERKSLRIPKSSSSIDLLPSQSVDNEKLLIRLGRKQPDERSEAESKASSDGRSSGSNRYSFEYQMDLHKKNNLFNGLRNVRICDYCLKQGDLYKCKGRCGGFFHLDCASKVTQPRAERRMKRKEKSPNKAKVRSAAPSVESTPKSDKTEERCKTRNQCQVQIITIKSKHAIGTPKKVNLPANFDELSLSEQIDIGMKEMMSKFENRTIYVDSTDSSSEEGSIIASKNKQLGILDSPASSVAVESEKSAAKSSDLEENGEEEKSSDDLEVSTLTENAEQSKLIKHVTADSVILTESDTPVDITNLKCTYCRMELDPPCFACGLEISKRGSGTRQKCSQYRCGRYYHPFCLKMWPQTQWSIGKWSRNQEQEDSFTCPAHTCHTCFSEELGSAACRLPGDKLARCVLCPAGFHATTFCIPAGTEILGGSQIVCPRHRLKATQPINTIWCFICSEGGNLICCDTCPTSVHPECQPINLTDDDKYICEDCESGRFPLYDEIVWVKLGQYRWWPALVLFPNKIPENIKALKHQRGDFAVRFFGTNDHYWVNKARSFLFQEGDRGGSPGEGNKSKNKVYETFGKAIEDAALAYKLKKEFKLRREAESINSLKPPTYVRINKNKPVGNVKSLELDLSNATACECDPNKPHPCGPDSNCINRLLMTECDPDVCPAGNRCRNQSFQKRDYPPMIPYKTQGRGWGLKCLAPIKKGQFVIEYVGELIDSEEYQRRIQKMHEQKEENYYFMTVDSDRMIDAGPKGNLSRFMNHCCNPNCVTQKWTVRGDTRVGLFAKCTIETGSELTFNYNLEVVGQEKKVCKCGATNCSGFIGVKAKLDKPEKGVADPVSEPEQRRPRKYNKKRAVSPPTIPPCFMCGRKQSDLTCNNKFCNKGYHLRCLKLEEMPEVTKFTCPRHNCNICSNRTIRCCVKCINSFCPSHSEGNVRHDKFLGFVCRLHDPGISSTAITSVTIRARGKPNVRLNKGRKSKNKSINSYPPEKREAIRAAWRLYKKRQYDKEKLMKINSKKSVENGLKITKTLPRTFKKSIKNRPMTPLPIMTVKLFRAEKSKKMYEVNVRKDRRGILSLPKEDRKSLWSMSREQSRPSRVNQVKELKKDTKLEELAIVTNTEQKSVAEVQENQLTPNQDGDVIINRPKGDQNHVTNIKPNGLEIVPSKIPGSSVTDLIDGELNIQNNLVTSDNHDDSNHISNVTQSDRSEFEPSKATKRRRQKPDSTDESTVSSTTSDEDSNSKLLAPPQKPIQKETEDELERDELVSSSPIKEPPGVLDCKEFPQQNDVNTSEDELTLDKRVMRRSGVKNPRKKIRFNVNSLVSTAKSS